MPKMAENKNPSNRIRRYLQWVRLANSWITNIDGMEVFKLLYFFTFLTESIYFIIYPGKSANMPLIGVNYWSGNKE